MKNKLTFGNVIYWILVVLPFAISAYFYDRLPDQMITHWNMQNQPDGYSSKNFACWGIPAFMLGIAMIVNIAFACDPKKDNIQKSNAIKQLGRWTVPAIGLLMQTIMMFSNIGVKLNIGILVEIPIGILLIVVGNYLPKCKPNYTMGIRLPWTLNNETNWRKTHRFSGYIWIVGGLLMIANAFLQWSWLFFVIIALVAISPVVYSFCFYKKMNRKENS
jgi:uncharacterized membrane protein